LQVKDKKFVIVAGYGWTGSSAVVDLLKEFSGYKELGTEFRIIKDPYGIMDLETALVEKWDLGQSDNAIRDFLWLANIHNRKNLRFSKIGLSYEDRISKDFYKHTEDYVNDLVDFEYKSHWYFLDCRESYPKYMYKKVLNRLGLSRRDSIMYFSQPSREVFNLKTQKYIASVFRDFSEKQNAKTVILDQAVQPFNAKKAFDYFNSVKVIIVDRDPRDNYIDLISTKGSIGRELHDSPDVEKYIRFHQARRCNNIRELNDKRILKMTFEELVLNYDE